MKNRLFTLLAIFLLMGSLSSCYVDIEVADPFVDVVSVHEYETKDVVYQEFENGVLVYEEAVYNAWIDIDLWNNGGFRARNVQVEIVMFDRHSQQTTVLSTKDIRPGETITVSYNTGYAFTNDYIDYDVYVYWD